MVWANAPLWFTALTKQIAQPPSGRAAGQAAEHMAVLVYMQQRSAPRGALSQLSCCTICEWAMSDGWPHLHPQIIGAYCCDIAQPTCFKAIRLGPMAGVVTLPNVLPQMSTVVDCGLHNMSLACLWGTPDVPCTAN
jgi:hypothetical protein